ncbi:hypothetical protein MHU86_13697 [Fragilaria crotonensis]|nr:hypothetical protein MHU86_13697 [Fragilaria crotonensis]
MYLLSTVDADISRIAGYLPKHDMTDILSIDLDQEAMEARLVANSDSSFEDARKYYTEGANSLSVATLLLAQPLRKTIKAGTPVVGEDDYNHDVDGIIYEDAETYATVLKFQYVVSEDTTRLCRVGALPISSQVVNGCLTRDNTILVTSTREVLAYTYNPYSENDNGRTLQSFSLEAKKKFYECSKCPYDIFLKFREYYGKSNYADEWISAAFEGRRTELNNGQANFEMHSLVGRGEAIKKGTSYLSIWMYVIGLMEDAVSSCQTTSPCTNDCNGEAVRRWDEAVALYTGSLEGTDGSGQGLLLYELADKKCTNFHTCGNQRDHDSGTSAVNLEIFTLFNSGQLDISNGLCGTARDHKERITDLMVVPLIQGALYYAYVNDRQGESGEKEEAAAAVFAAAILPLVHACNADDATKLWEIMAMGSGKTDFVSVKATLERNYACLGVTCVDVGGIYDTTTRSYYKDASPCAHGGDSNSSGSTNVGMIAGIVAGTVAAICLLTCCCLPLRRRKLMKRGKDMPPLEVSEAQQELEYRRELDEEFQRQLDEAEKRNARASPPRIKEKQQDGGRAEEVVALSPANTVKELVTVFDNSLV